MPPLKTLLRAPILAVDDDPNILALVRDLLTVEGYAVCTATNGAQALKVLERTAPRLVLLDMQMPVMDGWGFARVHKGRRDHVPVVVMTAACCGFWLAAAVLAGVSI
jgi:CheY-like chemotaxis protein